MSNYKRRRLFFLTAVCAIALIITNCKSTPNSDRTIPTTSTGNQQVLVYGSGGSPVNLEPGNVTDGNSLIVQQQIYDRLLKFKPSTADLQPSLATSWSVSADGKTWTFKLRPGVKFHDGTNFDAEAVKFNVERWWDAKNPNSYRNAGKSYEIWQQIFGGFKGDPNSLLQDFKVVDKSTIQFVLKQPFAAFPAAIGSGFFGIASPTAIKKAGANYGTPNSLAVGTGPFIFKEWRTGDRVTLANNPNYWQKGFPKTNQLVIRFITDPAARLAQLRAGQIDFTVDLAPDQIKEIQSDRNLDAVPRPSFNVGYLALNTSYKPLSDVRVRQAIDLAIDKQQIVQAFWGDLGENSPHFIPSILSWAQSKNLTKTQPNPQKAKQLLTQAGYPNGFDLELWYMPVSRPYFPTPKPIAEAFAADLSAIGIRVKLNTKDWAAYIADRKKSPGFQAFMLGWTADYGDPDSFYYPHFGPGGTVDIGGWKNDKVIQLLNQGRATGDKAARAKIYAQIDEILSQEVVRLPIVHSQPLLAKRKNVQGWIPSPLGTEDFAGIQKQ
ncbi:ABC transporter substrate-binding protein [Floridanema evergladense]|uniref:ABC transporter substrate-binding protein n=1 Tax=Floridaenema evergladense BLCC-F167 TaxID=3153639 RepID=A0ABV4WQP9_9CYAN